MSAKDRRILYAVLSAQPWRSMTVSILPGQALGTPKSCGIGFIPLFESAEDALEEYPDAQTVAVTVPATWSGWQS